ncbi:2,4-dienoyl-CoA reductase (NADPH) [Lachancea thermotolerans CBS 6340]|uniref:2,4-dienoyl-CoA reductase [(3E)-enoyl-CoA-producing] n=1 Tax=Lachancea thermotolerans (strain ATCC 56472 / CBS 6340 / NRRL Y-8284) TaxID=559295 RepID=C5DD21_LACTC|nr:KLTH0B07656p [Lachancea thermotolerans CBS 6340]CAR21682.1 KLTH0B07656p [Lachancea thermotolerans CBS 6340]
MPNSLGDSFVKDGPWKADLFQGKVAFVTGGAGTICRVQTEALVLLGCKAAIVGRNPEKTLEAAREISKLSPRRDSTENDSVGGDSVLAIHSVDVREIGQLEQAVARTVERFGRIDFVIAGAAGNFIAPFSQLSANAFKSVVSIDLLGSFNTAKACLAELKKNKGAILFVSATFHYYGVPFQSHVGAAKAGVDALSNALAVELGVSGIRSNCIAPGVIEGTEGVSRLTGNVSEEQIRSKIPLQRFGTTRDIAETTVYLFSDAAKYVTGTVHIVDGGMWHLGTHFGRDLYPQNLLTEENAKL